MEIKELYNQLLSTLSKNFTLGESKSILNILYEDLLEIRNPENDRSTLNEQGVKKMQEALQKITSGEPVNYITGIKEFFGLRFKVDPNVLIPRPETEELVYWIITFIGQKSGLNILDIGTGSGCIPITIDHLTKGKNYLSGCDVDSQALKVAELNNKRLAKNVDFFLCDVLNPECVLPKSYDIIISNPPYILKSEKDKMNTQALLFEPERALFTTSDDPLQFYKAVNDIAQHHLQKGGSLFYEISSLHKDELEEMMNQSDFTDLEFQKDMSGNWRMCKAIRK